MHTRVPNYERISVSDISFSENREIDKYFLSLLTRQRKGKINTAITRIDSSEIVRGSFVRGKDHVQYITNYEGKYVDWYIRQIRGGRRPNISIYWNHSAGNGGAYVCPDDEVALEAYKAIGVKFIPCMVLAPKEITAFVASIWTRLDGSNISITRKIRSNRTTIGIFKDKESGSLEYIFDLIEKCNIAMTSIKNFHLNIDGSTYYHFAMHRYIERCRSLLDSVAKMLEINRVSHALILTRALYDLFLNFYLDWISPEFFGPRIHFLSMIRMRGGGHAELMRALGGMERLFENSKEKAFISPFGHELYDRIYSRMSLDVHQSYGNIGSERRDFDDVYSDYSIKDITRVAGAITAEFLICILNDIGIDAASAL